MTESVASKVSRMLSSVDTFMESERRRSAPADCGVMPRTLARSACFNWEISRIASDTVIRRYVLSVGEVDPRSSVISIACKYVSCQALRLTFYAECGDGVIPRRLDHGSYIPPAITIMAQQ